MACHNLRRRASRQALGNLPFLAAAYHAAELSNLPFLAEVSFTAALWEGSETRVEVSRRSIVALVR